MQSSLVQRVDGRDATEHLLRAEAKLAGPCGREHEIVRRIVLDSRAGTVDITAPALQTRWAVPSDLPWVYAPLLHVAENPYLHLALGCALYLALSALPVIGWLATWVASLIGLGLLVSTRATGLLARRTA